MQTYLFLALRSSWAFLLALGLAAPVSVSAYTFQSLYNFSNGRGGAYPSSRLIISGDGSLYGATSGGGALENGEIFRLSPPSAAGDPWTFRVLYSFKGGTTDGTSPQDLTFDANGSLYGTTSSGGPTGLGSVFRLTPPAHAGGVWKESVLHFFSGPDGGFPVTGVTIGYNGVLFGTAGVGGTHQNGVVYELNPPAPGSDEWSEKVIYSFTGGSDGGAPSCALAIDQASELYGTASVGGVNSNGTVFRLTPPANAGGRWKFDLLYSFQGGTDGTLPYGGRLVFGKGYVLYGTTFGESLGRSNGGTVFSLTPPSVAGQAWTETVLHQFGLVSSDGFGPESGVILGSGGRLYGTTYSSTSSEDNGVVFELVPPSQAGGAWTENLLYSFPVSGVDGANPATPLALSPSGTILGTTSLGGADNLGNIFALR